MIVLHDNGLLTGSCSNGVSVDRRPQISNADLNVSQITSLRCASETLVARL